MSNSSNAAKSASLNESVPSIALSSAEWKIVSEILRRHVADRVVWAYGSRARGTRVKKYSDLDLAIEGPPLGHALSAMAEAFDESLLPFKVDVLEADAIDQEFRARIEADKVVLSIKN